ncbi:MAG: universal stress protein [Burkholderiales bacterium]
MKDLTERSEVAPPCLLAVVDEMPSGIHTADIAVALASRMRAQVLFHIAVPLEPINANSVDSLPSALATHHEQCVERTRLRFDQVMKTAASADVAATTELTIDEDPCGAAIRLAVERHCDLILVGTRGRGPLSQLIHSSLAAELAKLAPCPVVVCRDGMSFGAVTARTDTGEDSVR